eukprot:scaffold28812_cov78-Cyclotella_meneghiniana.AAC.2
MQLVRIADLAQLYVRDFTKLKSNAFALAFAKSDETPVLELDLDNMLGEDFSCLGIIDVTRSCIFEITD